MKRRKFIATASTAGTILLASDDLLWGKPRIQGANDKVRIGIAGWSDSISHLRRTDPVIPGSGG